jgi:hypothetical protein
MMMMMMMTTQKAPQSATNDDHDDHAEITRYHSPIRHDGQQTARWFGNYRYVLLVAGRFATHYAIMDPIRSSVGRLMCPARYMIAARTFSAGSNKTSDTANAKNNANARYTAACLVGG